MIIIDKWPGLVTNASPYAIPPGAAVTQVNLQVLTPGQLISRPGEVAVTWSSHAGSTAPILAAVRYQHGTAETIVYQNASGRVFVARGPA
jgi:hypothetical protein